MASREIAVAHEWLNQLSARRQDHVADVLETLKRAAAENWDLDSLRSITYDSDVVADALLAVLIEDFIASRRREEAFKTDQSGGHA